MNQNVLIWMKMRMNRLKKSLSDRGVRHLTGSTPTMVKNCQIVTKSVR